MSLVAVWTVKQLKKVSPERRLHIAAWLFWLSILLGILSTLYIAKDAFERILMAISWAAITLTAVDIILTADVRDEAD